MEAGEAGTVATMKSHRRELWTPMTEKHIGRIVGTAGDSLLVEFASASAQASMTGGHQDERSRSSGEVRPGPHASCLCSRSHYGRPQTIMGMTFKLIWINGPGRDLSQL